MDDDAVCQEKRVIAHRRQTAPYQATRNPLKKPDFVGADLSANAAVR